MRGYKFEAMGWATEDTNFKILISCVRPVGNNYHDNEHKNTEHSSDVS